MSNSVTATLAYGLVVDARDLDAGVASIADAIGVTAPEDASMIDAIRESLDAIGLRFEPVGSWDDTSWMIGRVIAEADGDDVGYETTTPAEVVAAMRRTKASREVFAAIRRAFRWVGRPRLVVVTMRWE
jgi:hypothetical protein